MLQWKDGCIQMAGGKTVAKKLKEVQEVKVQRPKRAKLSEEETLKRMEAFDERREQFIATVRKGKS